MSGGTIKSGNLQVGQDGTASNNFTWYQPAVADGTVRLGQGVAGATTKDMVTISGSTITLGGNLVQASTAAPAFSAYRTGTQSGISVATLTKVQINTEVFDTNNNFDSTTNYRFTPTVAGYYFVTGHVGSPTLSTSIEILAAIAKNSTQITWGGTGSSKGGIYPESLTTTLVYLNGTTDYVELFVYGTGATFSLEGDQLNTYFQAFLARSA